VSSTARPYPLKICEHRAVAAGCAGGAFFGLMVADPASRSSPEESMMAGIVPSQPIDHRALGQPAAGAGVELAAAATIP